MAHDIVDPLNDGITGWDKHFYAYYRYPPQASLWPQNGCPETRGEYYVLAIRDLESTSGASPLSPGFSCNDGAGHVRDWQASFDWVTSGYSR